MEFNDAIGRYQTVTHWTQMSCALETCLEDGAEIEHNDHEETARIVPVGGANEVNISRMFRQMFAFPRRLEVLSHQDAPPWGLRS